MYSHPIKTLCCLHLGTGLRVRASTAMPPIYSRITAHMIRPRTGRAGSLLATTMRRAIHGHLRPAYARSQEKSTQAGLQQR